MNMSSGRMAFGSVVVLGVSGLLWWTLGEWCRPVMVLAYLEETERPHVFLNSGESSRLEFEKAFEAGRFEFGALVAQSGKPMNIGSGVKVRLLREDKWSAWVRVLDGPYRGERGWVPAMFLVSEELVVSRMLMSVGERNGADRDQSDRGTLP